MKNGKDFLKYLMDDEEDIEDRETDLQFLSLVAMYFIAEEEEQEGKRMPSNHTIFVRNRLEWESHVTQLMEEGPNAFAQLYRMQHESFVKLCGLIEPFVATYQSKNVKSSNWWEKSDNSGN